MFWYSSGRLAEGRARLTRLLDLAGTDAAPEARGRALWGTSALAFWAGDADASGTDPEGAALSYARDLNNDLLYETTGQNVTFSAAGKPPGVYPVRVRAVDPFGAYAVAQTTVTVTGPGACPAGSRVGVATAKTVPGQLQATLLVDRHAPAQDPSKASAVSFVVADVCGDWPSFVGGGPGAFYGTHGL
jgi:hypothetical protein